jgi:hypothetical protein
MDGLIIHISWEWALGIVGTLIIIAWQGSRRFSVLETSMEWVKETLHDLKTGADNASNPAYAVHSPVNLNSTGEIWIARSGLRDYIDLRKESFFKACEIKKDTNPYEVQKRTFKLLDELEFDLAFEDALKKFSYEQGTTMSVLRRIGGIYLRNLCLENFNMKKEDIDKHDPTWIEQRV